MVISALGAAVLALVSCGPVPAPKPPTPTPSTPATRTVAVVVADDLNVPRAGVTVVLEDTVPPGNHTGITNGDGYIAFDGVTAALSNSAVRASAAACGAYAEPILLSTGAAAGNQTVRVGHVGNALENAPDILLPPITCHVDPSGIPLEQLAAIRGAMWPQGLGLPFGPRPGQPDNIIATDFFADYAGADQARILAWEKQQGYTHVVMGPIVDSDGYHGTYTPHDWRNEFDAFLDVMQAFWDNGQAPIVFIHPDGWTLEQTKALTPLFQSARAQRLMRIVVPSGWEPTQYGWSSCTWAGYASWARETFPNALVLIHTVADVDAPVGTDALCDDNGKPNGQGWARVAPFIHGWLIQNGQDGGAYRSAPAAQPTLAASFAAQFDPGPAGAAAHGVAWHFANGIDWWPTTSAWGNRPVMLYNAECTSFTAFWQHLLETDRTPWGDLAIRSGANGYLDGGTVPVPVKQ
jgi:hypothetical protein